MATEDVLKEPEVSDHHFGFPPSCVRGFVKRLHEKTNSSAHKSTYQILSSEKCICCMKFVISSLQQRVKSIICVILNVLNCLFQFYEDIAWYMVGFVICIAIGVILILVMIFTGFIMCCCRCCCGRCGGDVDPQEGRNSKRQRICCGVLLFVFTTILLWVFTVS